MAIDYELIFGAEEYDPCAALVALRPAYMKLRSGVILAEVTFRDRTVKYHQSDVAEFGNLISQLESECAAKRGRAPSRHAVTAGYRRNYRG